MAGVCDNFVRRDDPLALPTHPAGDAIMFSYLVLWTLYPGSTLHKRRGQMARNMGHHLYGCPPLPCPPAIDGSPASNPSCVRPSSAGEVTQRTIAGDERLGQWQDGCTVGKKQTDSGWAHLSATQNTESFKQKP